jgi:hypothetical protein
MWGISMTAEEKRVVPLAPLVGIVANMQTEEIFRPIVEVIHFMTGRAEPLSDNLFEEMRSICKEELVKKNPLLGQLGDEYRALYETTLRPLDDDATWKTINEWMGFKELKHGDISVEKLANAPSRPHPGARGDLALEA